MAADWAAVPLGDLVDPHRGISYGIVQPGKPVKDGVPVVRVADVRNGRIDVCSPLRVSPEIERSYGRTRLRGGELLITIVGTVDETAIVPPDLAGWNVARAIAVLPVRPEIGSYWVRLALRASEAASMIQSRLNTTVQATLNLGDLSRLPIVLPPPFERNAIAAILGTLDDKIELNRRMSATLEAMARALFKAWFVDFDPVRAKAEGRNPGLPLRLAALFPDRLIETEHGEVPEEWSAGTLSDFADLNPEVWTKDTRPEEIRYVDLSNTKWGRIEVITLFQREDAPSRAQRVLRPNDTIVGTVRPGNGSFAFITDEGLTGSTGFALLRPRLSDAAELIYLAATSEENIEALAHLADGAAYPAVRADVVAATPTVIPPVHVLTVFSDRTRPILARIAQNNSESRTLAALRHALLPKLISGELRVKDAETFLERAL